MVISSEDVLSGAMSEAKVDSNHVYWRAENHTSDGNSYLRAENWLKDVEDLTLSEGLKKHVERLRQKNALSLIPENTGRAVVRMTLAQGAAMLRYTEEIKMFANIRDMERAKIAEAARAKSKGEKSTTEQPEEVADSLHDSEYLDEHWQTEVLGKWPASKERGPWFQALMQLRDNLEVELKRYRPMGAFIKLSVRSPKDAVFSLTKTKACIQNYIKFRGLEQDSPILLSENVKAIRHASWQGLRCMTGDEALQLLLRSERIYLDVLQHELFNKGDPEKFSLDVHLAPFFEGFDPALEFRGFVADGKRTSLTAYSPWVYDKRIIDHKDTLLGLMIALWDKAQAKIQSQNFSIDFAISNELSECWLVEINNFLPPLAGCGLFNFYDEHDRAVLEGKVGFEFRIRMEPLEAQKDFVRTRTNKDTGRMTTTIMQPAPPHIMAFVDKCRGYKPAGPPLDLKGAEVKQD